MGRPPKPHLVIVNEKKSHRTKKELEIRKKGEESLLTGFSLREWPDTKANPIAHKEFMRIRKLLKKINKDDALHEAVINRYCMLTAECKQVEQTITELKNDIVELAERLQQGDIDYMTYLDKKGSTQDRIITWDKKVMDKRKMLLQIEKENIMTIMAALRAVPKKPQEEEEDDPMSALLKRKAGGK